MANGPVEHPLFRHRGSLRASFGESDRKARRHAIGQDAYEWARLVVVVPSWWTQIPLVGQLVLGGPK
jgi:hypothetical protein